MSRGLGKMQNALLWVIEHHGKPLTFAEICAEWAELAKLDGIPFPADPAELRPSVVRSWRRALHRMVATSVLIALGDGRPGNPYRYFLHPVFIFGEMGDTPEAQALMKALEDFAGDAGDPASMFYAPASLLGCRDTAKGMLMQEMKEMQEILWELHTWTT
jgi:hypothetical protein